jgi:hypothetical protein
MSNILDEFTISIKTLFDNQGAQKASQSISSLSKQLLTMATVGAVAINRIFEGFGNKYANLSMKASLIKSSVGDLNKYITAGDMSIYTTGEAVKSDIEGLLDTIRKVKTTGQIPIGFQMAGIDISQKPEQILEQFRDVFSKSSAEMSFNIAESSGLANIYQVLKMTKNEMQEISGIAFLTDEQINKGIQAAEMMKKVRNQFVVLKDITVAELAPALNNSLISFFDWIKLNQGGIINLFRNTILVFQSFAVAVGRVVGFIAEFIKNITSTKLGMHSLSIAFGILLFALKPTWFYLSAIVIIFEDLIAYFKTGGGAIGDFVNKFGKLNTLGIIGGIGGITMALGLLSKALSKNSILASNLFGKAFNLGKIATFAGGAFAVTDMIKDLTNKDKPKEEKGIGNLLEKTIEGAMVGTTIGTILPVIGNIAGGVGGAVTGLGAGIYQNYFQGGEKDKKEENKNISQNFNINIDATGLKDGADIGNKLKKSLDIENLLIGGY